jgi:hypothetical protein
MHVARIHVVNFGCLKGLSMTLDDFTGPGRRQWDHVERGHWPGRAAVRPRARRSQSVAPVALITYTQLESKLKALVPHAPHTQLDAAQRRAIHRGSTTPTCAQHCGVLSG